MEEWCENYACYEPKRDEDGKLRKPTWHRGDSLWQYSVTDYHAARSMEAANTSVKSERVAEQLLAAVRRGGVNITMEQLCRHNDGPALWNRAFDEVMRRSQP